MDLIHPTATLPARSSTSERAAQAHGLRTQESPSPPRALAVTSALMLTAHRRQQAGKGSACCHALLPAVGGRKMGVHCGAVLARAAELCQRAGTPLSLMMKSCSASRSPWHIFPAAQRGVTVPSSRAQRSWRHLLYTPLPAPEVWLLASLGRGGTVQHGTARWVRGAWQLQAKPNQPEEPHRDPGHRDSGEGLWGSEHKSASLPRSPSASAVQHSSCTSLLHLLQLSYLSLWQGNRAELYILRKASGDGD